MDVTVLMQMCPGKTSDALVCASEQAVVPSEVLTSWLAEGGQHAAPEAAEQGGVLRLFSSNDYMGLSTHPAVRQAAADAALLYGMGARTDALTATACFAALDSS
jgi:7-keto-8-aminopelargonate synthetase-like enzyme